MQNAGKYRLSPSKHTKTPLRGRKSSYGAKIRARKKNNTITDEWLQEHWGFKSQVDLFNHLWDSYPHYCWYTGKSLVKFRDNKDMRYRCCAHIIPKGKFPLFKLNEENVRLVHPDFHRIVDQGTQEERDDHPLWRFGFWDQEVERMKKEYEAFKKKYLF